MVVEGRFQQQVNSQVISSRPVVDGREYTVSVQDGDGEKP